MKSKVSVKSHRTTEVQNSRYSLVSCENNKNVNTDSHVPSTQPGEFSYQPAFSKQTDDLVGDKNKFNHSVGRMQANDVYNG